MSGELLPEMKAGILQSQLHDDDLERLRGELLVGRLYEPGNLPTVDELNWLQTRRMRLKLDDQTMRRINDLGSAYNGLYYGLRQYFGPPKIKRGTRG